MSSYRLIEYDPNYFEKWNSFIDSSVNGTLFHKLDFLNYHGNKFKNEEKHLIWLKGETVFGILPLAIFNIDGTKTAKSPYASSFGGIVHLHTLKLRHALKLVTLLDEYLLENNIKSIDLKIAPFSYNSSQNNYIEFALLKNGYTIEGTDLFNILPLNNNIAEQEKIYEGRTRTVLRKVSDDFEIKENAGIEEFYPVLLEDKKRLNNSIPTHSLTDLIHLKEKFPDKIKTDIAIHKKNNSKAGVCYFEAKNNHTIMTFYIAQEDNAKGLNGPTVLIDFGIRRAIKNGFKFLDFGSSSFGYQIQNMGVAEFKESFGATGLLRKHFNKNF